MCYARANSICVPITWLLSGLSNVYQSDRLTVMRKSISKLCRSWIKLWCLKWKLHRMPNAKLGLGTSSASVSILEGTSASVKSDQLLWRPALPPFSRNLQGHLSVPIFGKAPWDKWCKSEGQGDRIVEFVGELEPPLRVKESCLQRRVPNRHT